MDHLKQTLREVFVNVLNENIEGKEDQDYLLEFSITSLQFISLIVEIELKFSI